MTLFAERRFANRTSCWREASEELVHCSEISGAHAREWFPWHWRSSVLAAAALETRDECLPVREFEQRAARGRRQIRRLEPHVGIGAGHYARLHVEAAGKFGARRRKRHPVAGGVAPNTVRDEPREILATFPRHHLERCRGRRADGRSGLERAGETLDDLAHDRPFVLRH